MSFGFTAAEIGVGIAAVGAAVSVYSAVSTANAQKAAADYQAQVNQNNEKIAADNANMATSQGNQQLQAEQEQAAQQQGMIRAVMGASGVDINSGSALRTQQGVAQVNSLNEATITSNAARSAWNYTNQGADYSAQSNLEILKGENSQTAGYLSGLSSLIGSAGQTYKNYNNNAQVGAT
ncbi:Phage protein [Collimonas arenae]|uniref:Phage protein n=1 Tax=Collimonas arenae TaxID=279058 RepID=A0A0A1FBI3_9BURK|nr:hypothetical protein [Collimonas arenae]AIY40192.1 Phage protein [Collimonas arenae]